MIRRQIWDLRGGMAHAALVSGITVTLCFLLARWILPDLEPPWLLSLAVCAIAPAIQLLLMLLATLVPAQVSYKATSEGIRIAGGKTRFVGWSHVAGWNVRPDETMAGASCLLLRTKQGVRGHALPDGPDRGRLLELIAGSVLRDETLILPPPRRAPVYSGWLYPWALAVGVALGLAAAGAPGSLQGRLLLFACLAVLLAGPGTLAALVLPAMRRLKFEERAAPAIGLNLLALWMAFWILALSAIRDLGAGWDLP